MASEPRRDVRYLPQRCPFLRQDVWAIVTRQADGSWRVVNCLDKEEGCFAIPCAFTTCGGDWPFALTTLEQPAT